MLSQLQKALREIEQGRTLEPVDGLIFQNLIKGGSLQKKNECNQQQQLEKQIDGNEAYRTLVALRRQKKRQQQQQQHKPKEENVGQQTTNSTSDTTKQPQPSANEPAAAEQKLQRKILAEHEILKKQLDNHIQNLQQQTVQQNAQVISALNNQLTRQLHQQSRSMQQQQKKQFIQNINVQQTQLLHMQQLLTQSKNQLDQELANSKALMPLEFLFARNLQEFCQHQSIEKLQTLIRNFQTRLFGECWAKWHRFIEYMRQIEREQAVNTIIRVFHGHRARQQCRQLRHTQQEIVQQEKQLRVFKTRFRHAQAWRIQMAWRRFKRFKIRQQKALLQQMVVRIQKKFRYKRSRRKAWAEFIMNVKRVAAAVAIQKQFRGLSARKKYRNLQKQKQREEHLKRILNFQVGFQQQFEKLGAISLLNEKFFQPWIARKRHKQQEFEAKRKQATQVLTKVMWRYVLRKRQRKWFQAIQRAKVVPNTRHRQPRKSKFPSKIMNAEGTFENDQEREAFRLQEAAICIQKHLRRWHQQRRYWVVLMRQKKLARKKRLELKHQKLQRGGRYSIASKLKTLVAPHRDSTGNTSTKVQDPTPHSAALSAVPTQATTKRVSMISSLLLNNKNSPLVAARKIQKAYIRFCRVRRASYQLYRQQARQVELHIEALHKSATHIQRRFRGMQARRFVKHKRKQRFQRCLLRRWFIHTRWTRRKAANCIQRAFRAFQSRNLGRILRKQQHKEAGALLVIQKWFRRRVFLRTIWPRQLARWRLHDEELTFSHQSLVICQQHAIDQVALTSLESDLDHHMRKYIAHQHTLHPHATHHQPSFSAQASVFAVKYVSFPIFQLLFLLVAGFSLVSDKNWEFKTIQHVSLERSKVIAMFKAINKHVNSSDPSQPLSVHKQASVRHHRGSVTSASTGAGASTSGDFFSSSDVDLAIAKAAGATKRLLTYEEFGSILRHAAATKLSHCTNWWSRFQGNDAQVLMLLWKYIVPVALYTPLGQQFRTHLDQFIVFQANRIQKAYRIHFAWKHSLFFRAKLRVQARQSKEHLAAVQIQSLLRQRLATRRLTSQMQRVYLKFFDLTLKAPYWLNPRTGFSTWQKPLWLGVHDVLTPVVPLADRWNEFVVLCDSIDCKHASSTTTSKTERITAKVFCHDCDESYCQKCQDRVHLTPSTPTTTTTTTTTTTPTTTTTTTTSSSSHDTERIIFCGLCQFQIATRQCLDCTRARTTRVVNSSSSNPVVKRVNSSHLTDQETRDYYCDCCFSFMHQRGNLVAHQIEPLVELCTQCHNQRAVRQRCRHHNRTVCNTCAAIYHSPEICGSSLTPLRFESLSIRKHKQQREAQRLEREKQDQALQALRVLNARKEKSASKIQKAFRKFVARVQARRQLVALADQSSKHWQQIQQDTKRSRQLKYLVQDLFGKAGSLTTDSPTMKILRPMHWEARRRLTQRAKHYGLLLDEYLHQGIPLPGTVTIYRGSSSIETSEDLRGWVKNRQLVRIDDQYLYVDGKMKLTESSIPLAKVFDKDNRINAQLFLIEFSAHHEALLDTSHTFMRFLRQSLTTGSTIQANQAALVAEAQSLSALTARSPTATAGQALSADNQYYGDYSNDPATAAANAAANAQYWNGYWAQPQLPSSDQLVSSQQYYYGAQGATDVYGYPQADASYDPNYAAQGASDAYGYNTSYDPIYGTVDYQTQGTTDAYGYPQANTNYDVNYGATTYDTQGTGDAYGYPQANTNYDANYGATTYDTQGTGDAYGYPQANTNYDANYGATTYDTQGTTDSYGNPQPSASYDPTYGTTDATQGAYEYPQATSSYDSNYYASPAAGVDGTNWAGAQVQSEWSNTNQQVAASAEWYQQDSAVQQPDQYNAAGYDYQDYQDPTQQQAWGTEAYPAMGYDQPVDPNAYAYSTEANGTWNNGAADGGYGSMDPSVSQPSATGAWQEAYDPSSGQMYFYNTVTGESSWERPA